MSQKDAYFHIVTYLSHSKLSSGMILHLVKKALLYCLVCGLGGWNKRILKYCELNRMVEYFPFVY